MLPILNANKKKKIIFAWYGKIIVRSNYGYPETPQIMPLKYMV